MAVFQALSATFLLAQTVSAAKPVKPHIFLVLADDFGWHNIGWRNSEIRSPNLDALAADGIKLDRHYTFKYCSPTRSSLLTGRLPLHVNQNNECNTVTSRSGIDLRMTLLPQKMKLAGYKTAMTGKWHCGARSEANLPINRGFDRHFGFLKGGEDHLTQCLGDPGPPAWHGPDLWRDHGPATGENGTFSTLLYGPEAVKIVKEHPMTSPLFMYLPFQVTHSPYEIPGGNKSPYVNPSDPKERMIMNAMVNIMDEAVGNLTAALKHKHMDDNTLMVFSADNGGVMHGGQLGNNWPLRGQKTSSWEGGVRVTAFVWGGKDVMPANLRGTINSAFIHVCDWYATLTNLVGVNSSDNLHIADGIPPIDGIDQWEVLMKPNATSLESLRIEVPLAFCPNHTGGSDNCNPTAEGGGWKPNGTKLEPREWRNGALIQKVGNTFYKLVWGKQFGFGVRTSPFSPNATGKSHKSTDPGCPEGCLFDILEDETETTDIKSTNEGAAIFKRLIARQQEIGLSVFQTNHSDVDDDTDCITMAEMTAKYNGFLGPRCGVKRPSL